MARISPFLPRHGPILDIGCGTGHNGEQLRRLGLGPVTEADVVDFKVVGPRPTLFDGRTLPFADGEFETVTLVYVLQYAPDPAALLHEARRVCRGALWVIQTVGYGSAGARFHRGIEWISRLGFLVARSLRAVGAVPCPLQVRLDPSPEDLRRIARKAGLVACHWQTERQFPFLPLWRVICRLESESAVKRGDEPERLPRFAVRDARLSLQRVGNLLASTRFNSVTPQGSGYVRKSRLGHAVVLVAAANWYAARLGIRLRVLTRSAWLRHEPLMYQLLLGCRAREVNGALLLPQLPGRTLSSWLHGCGRVAGQSASALQLAVTELARLHACRTPHPWDGRLRLFSHGDATAENVLVDLDRERAHWIDFETTHDPSLPDTTRHAEDLLTLLCSAAAAVSPEEPPRLCEILVRSYGTTPAIQALLDLLRAWDKCPVARRLAFPSLSDDRWRRLCDHAREPGVSDGGR